MVFYIAITRDNCKGKTKKQPQTYEIIAKLYCFISVLSLGSVLLPQGSINTVSIETMKCTWEELQSLFYSFFLFSA